MENLKSLYVDQPQWEEDIKQDDFIVAVSDLKSNSVYHVFSSRIKKNPEKRMNRYYLKVFVSDLITCLKREKQQRLVPIKWYSRNKNKK